MDRTSNIVSFIHHLKLASEYAQDFTRQHGGTKPAIWFKNYVSKIDWIKSDMQSQPFWLEVVRQGINRDGTAMYLPCLRYSIKYTS